MDTCSNCDFCCMNKDGQYYCCLYDMETDEYDCCPDHQSNTRLIDGDELRS